MKILRFFLAGLLLSGLGLVLILAPKLRAQSGPPASQWVIQWQNQGSVIMNRAGGFLPINCSTGITCTYTGGVVVMTVSGAGGAAFSGLTSGTNTTAAMLCGSGCTLGPAGTGIVAASATVDASLYAGADWIAKVNAAIAAASGPMTVLIPAGLAGNATTVPALGSASLDLEFGCGVFGSTHDLTYNQITATGFVRISGSGSCTVLQINGTNNGIQIIGTVGGNSNYGAYVGNLQITDPTTSGNAGIYLNGPAAGWHVENVMVRGSGHLAYGILTSAAQQGEINSNYIQSITTHAIDFTASGAVTSNGEVHGNTIDCSGGGTSTVALYANGGQFFSHDNQVVNCYTGMQIVANGTAGTGNSTSIGDQFELYNTVGLVSAGPVFVVGDKFYGCAACSPGPPAGDFHLQSGSSHSVIRDSLLDWTGSTIDSGSNNNSILNNQVGGNSYTITDNGSDDQCLGNWEAASGNQAQCGNSIYFKDGTGLGLNSGNFALYSASGQFNFYGTSFAGLATLNAAGLTINASGTSGTPALNFGSCATCGLYLSGSTSTVVQSAAAGVIYFSPGASPAWYMQAAGELTPFTHQALGDASNYVGGTVSSYFQAGGTKFTASGCSNSTTVGGATAGSFASGTTGACTVTITMGNSDTATNGWACFASDQTTPANLYDQKSGGSTTTAVLSGTTVSGDVISFGCMAY